MIDGFRWCLLRGHQPFYFPGLLTGLGVTVALVLSGLWYFRRTERSFADVI